MKVSGSTALILGATRGIGRAIAFALADAGARIIFPYYDWPESSQDTIAQFKARGPEHLFFQTDLRDPKQVQTLFDKIRLQVSSLDIVINNIERGGMPIVHGAYTDEQWALEIDTTLKAKWLVVQNALPLMKSSPQAAMVILSSIAGMVGRSGPAGLIFNDAYAAANQAVASLTRTWARQGAPSVRVNELILGFIEQRHGPGTRGWQLLTKEQRNAIEKQVLLERTGSVDEVVKTVMFLVQEATYMTGASIVLDGGYCLGSEHVPEIPQAEDNLEVTIAPDLSPPTSQHFLRK